jgi:hypothetical protein
VPYDPSRAEPPDDHDRFNQPRNWPAGAGRYQPVPRPRDHHDAAPQPPALHADSHRRPRHAEDATLHAARHDASRNGPAAAARPRSTRSKSRANAATMTAAASFWYVLGCIAVGGMYLAKVPCKKALEEAGLATMTSAERFWYVLGCLPLGAFYFCKLPMKKALTETHGL